MERRFTKFYLQKWVQITLLLGFCLVLYFVNLGRWGLWEPDETRYAVVAREMRETEQWILPRLNGAIYAEKPPLFFSLVNLSTFFLGQNNGLTNRLPSALAGLIGLFVTFLPRGKFFNARVGFLSALVPGRCFSFPKLSR